MKKRLLAILLTLLTPTLIEVKKLQSAESRILQADFRQRPPEMIVDKKSISGPLKDILEEAAKEIRFEINWRIAPFPRSLDGLKDGTVDIVPRTIRNAERERFIKYLGPIGQQQKDILFLVRRGQESLLNNYEDLYKLEVGVKRDTAYFDRFNHDRKMKKRMSLDDHNMARMFINKRFETMIVLDKKSIEKELAANNFRDYAYANYRHVQKIGNYFGMSKKSKHIRLYVELNAVLLRMVRSGRIAAIYKKYGLKPPAQ